jgi:hypothetical protein
VISPAIGFLVTVALRKLARPARLGVSASARLDAGTEASGPHDFAVRFSTVRLARLTIAHRQRPPCDFIVPDAAASTASRSNVRDDGQRPFRSRTGWIA